MPKKRTQRGVNGRHTRPATLPSPVKAAWAIDQAKRWIISLPTNFWIYLGLLVVTVFAYLQVRSFEFINFDDPDYVTGNPHVRAGLTFAGVIWAFTSREAANWFPLTWFSHMLDCQLFWLRSGFHHLTNVFWHVLATLMLYAFLYHATRARWRSAVVAFLFALHPLHVESVAWIAERKDVLSAFFWFLTLWAYLRYTERPTPLRYALALASFSLDLMAKPMAVTLPFVLLLLDMWPLRRALLIPNREYWRKVIVEKLAFLALSAIVVVVTFWVQRASGAVQALSALPIALRVENAVVSYVVYVGQMFWPVHLAVFYPYPSALTIWQAAAATLAIIGTTILVLRRFRPYPYLAIGWFWYLGTLVPVIGLVQVGPQARADRYTYIPMVGLTIMLAWGVTDLLRRWQPSKAVRISAAMASCVPCFALTCVQIQNWRDSESLFRHALAVTQRNYLAEHNLGVALAANPAQLPEAITHLRAAVNLAPNSAKARTDLGNALANIPGHLQEAVSQYEAALRLAPNSAIAHNDLANALARLPGRLEEALSHYRQALRLRPDYAEAHNNLGTAFAAMLGRLPDAIAEFQAALRIDPNYSQARANLNAALLQDPARRPEALAQSAAATRHEPDSADAHANLASALERTPGRLQDAIAEYKIALRLRPDSAILHYNLGTALAKAEDRLPEAIAEYEAAVRLKPDYAEAYNNLGVSYSRIPGRLSEAIPYFESALRIRPDYADAHYNLGIALANTPGRMSEAIRHVEEALRLKPDPEIQRTLDQLRVAQRQ